MKAICGLIRKIHRREAVPREIAEWAFALRRKAACPKVIDESRLRSLYDNKTSNWLNDMGGRICV